MDRILIAIVGPTGAGKSALAMRLAEIWAGEIVNCDSLQFYRGFDIGTAKIPGSARRGIPHHLFDAVEPKTGYSAGDYARDARQVIAGISRRGHVPVVVGGTGFYLRALLEGLPGLPGRDQELRADLGAREQRHPGILHRLLRRLDPPAANRIHSNDVQKLIRALEVRILTRSAAPSAEAAEPLRGYQTIKIGLNPGRPALYTRLDARVETMFRSGLIEEVQGLLASGLTGQEKPFESLGYKQVLQHLHGEITREEAAGSTQIETRRYAKRQGTWFRQEKNVHWLPGFGDDPAIFELSQKLIQPVLLRTDSEIL